jgi:hypothetical protein
MLGTLILLAIGAVAAESQFNGCNGGHDMQLGKTETVLRSLRANVEYDDGEYGMVYLDNARPSGMTDKSFRACLSNLSFAGLYKVEDGYAWGKVKLAD